MATPEQVEFLRRACGAARLAHHVWSEYAACEAALETAWGTSRLYLQGNNVFGEKQHAKPVFLTVTLPTREYRYGVGWITVQAPFIWFPSPIEAFEMRMQTLRRLAVEKNSAGELEYPEYAAALAATSGEAFVTEVSKRWSTDPERGAKVLEIFNAHMDVFAGAATSAG